MSEHDTDGFYWEPAPGDDLRQGDLLFNVPIALMPQKPRFVLGEGSPVETQTFDDYPENAPSDLIVVEALFGVPPTAVRMPRRRSWPGYRGWTTTRAQQRIQTYRGDRRMKLPNTAHTSRPWRIHELTGDFRLEDVWALPTPGGPGDFPRLVNDFPRLVQGMTSGASSRASSRAAGALWALRWKIGALLGWESPDAGLGTRVPTLRDRLPVDLRDAPSGPDLERFSSLYLLDDEWAAEIANRTVHGILHLGWVPNGTGGYRGQMAVYVKPNGPLGAAYMAAIRPFRHLLVYPAMLREIERAWQSESRVAR